MPGNRKAAAAYPALNPPFAERDASKAASAAVFHLSSNSWTVAVRLAGPA